MNDFLKKIIKGNGVIPSEVCQKSLKQNFEDAVNVEWFNKDNHSEAIFYKNETEYIAIFNLSGKLLEYKHNLQEDHLPTAIKNRITSMGVIMNLVVKNKDDILEYEVILRDKDLNRYLIILSDTGSIIEETKL
ncbi:hypothetical protein [Draconibacterium mangrovi]|uniref:hypothetical protein n=1 Tax=Draconibacterium mangrovi TaxID=2697469 RepID=UPI0013D69C90|nr:hypothetical protein [Draconibacterium mangrovi]